MVIQNESKKIAVTAAQKESLKEAYQMFLIQNGVKVSETTPVTNETIVNDILSTPVSVPEQDVLITDAPKEEAPVVDTTNIFEQNIVVEEPKSEVTPVVETKVEEPVVSVISTEPAPVSLEQPTTSTLDNDYIKKLLDDFYELQVHVQEFSVELEEILEKLKKNLNAETKETTPMTETPVAEQPAVEPTVAPQNNEVINSFNPNENFTGNIFDMPPMENNASGLKL